jgi:hypothetical protein
MEGFSVNPGDRVAVALTRVRWGQQADIESVSLTGGQVTISLTTAMRWEMPLQHYVGFSTSTGAFSSLYPASRGSADNVLVLSSVPAISLRGIGNPVPTRVIFGSNSGEIVRDALVISATAQDMYHARLSCVIDSDAMYDDSASSMPAVLQSNCIACAPSTGVTSPFAPSAASSTAICGEYIFGSPSVAWQINHNRNAYPAVTVIDTAGSTIIGGIEYLDANTLTITFTAPFAGKAYLR